MKILEKIIDWLPIFPIAIVLGMILGTLTKISDSIEQQNVLLGRFQADTSKALVISVHNSSIDSLRKYHYNQKKSYEIKNQK